MADGILGRIMQNRLARLSIYFLVTVAVILAAVSVYLHALLQAAPPVQNVTAKPFMDFSASTQAFVSYDITNRTYAAPYVLFNYRVSNVSKVGVIVNLFKVRPPTKVYILNWTNQCFSCGDVKTFLQKLDFYMLNYSVINSTSSVSVVGQQGLGALGSDALLIIPTGYLPSYLLSQNFSANYSISALLRRGVSIIYIGRNFSREISPQGVVVSNNFTPFYLSTGPFSYSNQNAFYFNSATFSFSSGRTQGPITYESAYGGYVVAFSNFLSTWGNMSQAASDVALAASQYLWLPSYAVGARVLSLNGTKPASGSFGLLLNLTPSAYSRQSFESMRNGYFRALFLVMNSTANQTAALAGGSPVGQTLLFAPTFTMGGLFNVTSTALPGSRANATITIFLNKSSFIEPHVEVYDLNMTRVASFPPLVSVEASSNYTFYDSFEVTVGPGAYVARLVGFNAQDYGDAYFAVPPASFTLRGYNISSSNNTFVFATSQFGGSLNGQRVTVSLNGNYSQQVLVSNNTLVYTLPPGAVVRAGNLSIIFKIFNYPFVYNTRYVPPSASINSQYIEFIVVLVIVMLEITLIKPPTTDDFYIDVPSFPAPHSIKVSLKSADLLSAFDKLNMSYHWSHMPLSVPEFRAAVSSNIRINNIPATLTLGNIDLLLGDMVSKGAVISVDGLYAPSSWVPLSKHDIVYLATFKKLRVYLVSSALLFTDIDRSTEADIVTTVHNEKAYIVIYSSTSRFLSKIPVYPSSKTYLAFLNSDVMDEFKRVLYESDASDAARLKMYISAGEVVLMDADDPAEVFG